MRGKPNPYLRVNEADHGNRAGEEVWALKDISFQVQQGEVLGVIGRNGAGKSTLLKILSRVTAPTSGEIKVRGRVASLLEVGTGFHPDLTGRENVFLNGAILGMTRAEVVRKFDEIVDFTGVEKFIDTPVKRYSSGMYVRLAFAVAAHLDPEILVVDEVLAVGDAEFQKKCLGKMGEVAQSGRTVLFVSHNMGAIKNLCTQCLLLNAGEIEDFGETNQVVQKYFSPLLQSKHGGILNLPRRAGTSEVLVKDVTVGLNPNDSVGNMVPFTSDLHVNIDVLAKARVINASAFLLIKSASGDYVLSPFQRDANQTFSLEPGEECRIQAKFPHNLMPGIYFVDVGIFDQFFHFYDWIESAANFTVIEEGQLRGRLGYVAPDSKWKISK